jgi:DNA-binding GntR family transcriptional regulator
MIDRKRYRQQCKEHLPILDLLKAGKNEKASQVLRRPLEHTVENLNRIKGVLEH